MNKQPAMPCPRCVSEGHLPRNFFLIMEQMPTANKIRRPMYRGSLFLSINRPIWSSRSTAAPPEPFSAAWMIPKMAGSYSVSLSGERRFWALATKVAATAAAAAPMIPPTGPNIDPMVPPPAAAAIWVVIEGVSTRRISIRTGGGTALLLRARLPELRSAFARPARVDAILFNNILTQELAVAYRSQKIAYCRTHVNRNPISNKNWGNDDLIAQSTKDTSTQTFTPPGA
jgi:hypothetical protein